MTSLMTCSDLSPLHEALTVHAILAFLLARTGGMDLIPHTTTTAMSQHPEAAEGFLMPALRGRIASGV